MEQKSILNWGKGMNENRSEFIHQLHIKFYQRLIRTAYRETGDMETAADLVQEVFMLATLHYDTLRTYDAPGGLAASDPALSGIKPAAYDLPPQRSPAL